MVNRVGSNFTSAGSVLGISISTISGDLHDVGILLPLHRSSRLAGGSFAEKKYALHARLSEATVFLIQRLWSHMFLYQQNAYASHVILLQIGTEVYAVVRGTVSCRPNGLHMWMMGTGQVTALISRQMEVL